MRVDGRIQRGTIPVQGLGQTLVTGEVARFPRIGL